MADVTQDAGLSSGIVNLHFLSKDKLFEETLLYLSDEYEAFCANALKCLPLGVTSTSVYHITSLDKPW